MRIGRVAFWALIAVLVGLMIYTWLFGPFRIDVRIELPHHNPDGALQ